jgi:hypothetical protein
MQIRTVLSATEEFLDKAIIQTNALDLGDGHAVVIVRFYSLFNC